MNQPMDDLWRMMQDHFNVKRQPKPCKVCGDPTEALSALCSNNCIIEFYGLTDAELRDDHDEENAP